jgi:hypothetical protein
LGWNNLFGFWSVYFQWITALQAFAPAQLFTNLDRS